MICLGVENPENSTADVLVLPSVDALRHRPDYLPQAIPDDLADRLSAFHGYPAAWWIGQIIHYLVRPNDNMQRFLKMREMNVTSRRPIVGSVCGKLDFFYGRLNLLCLINF